MKTNFGRFTNWRLLMVLVALTLLLALTLATDLGSRAIQVVSTQAGLRLPNTGLYSAESGAAEIDRQVQQMDAPRFNLGSRSTTPMIVCPPGTACAD